jgi:hypothetical protein
LTYFPFFGLKFFAAKNVEQVASSAKTLMLVVFAALRFLWKIDCAPSNVQLLVQYRDCYEAYG